MGTEHLVSLSRQALAVLDELKQYTGGDELLFTGERSRLKPISENTMIYELRLGDGDVFFRDIDLLLFFIASSSFQRLYCFNADSYNKRSL